eukprot:4848943-Prymnesium_polylepis.1
MQLDVATVLEQFPRDATDPGRGDAQRRTDRLGPRDAQAAADARGGQLVAARQGAHGVHPPHRPPA